MNKFLFILNFLLLKISLGYVEYDNVQIRLKLEEYKRNPILAFNEWLDQHKKMYYMNDSQIYFERFEIWYNNLNNIINYNNNHKSHWLTLNQFADLKQEEFQEINIGFKKDDHGEVIEWEYEKLELTELPNKIDWRTQGVVTPAKDQEHCGSCWAFSAIGCIESINAIRTGILLDLSEQELIDCDHSKYSKGCGGGTMIEAYRWIISNGGIATEQDYIYKAQEFECNSEVLKYKNVTINGYQAVPPGQVNLIKALSLQPVSVGIDANSFEFQFYGGGIFDEYCTDNNLSHAVDVIGYDMSSDISYFIIKNSWGQSWGESGTMRLAMLNLDDNNNGLCGIAQFISYPIK